MFEQHFANYLMEKQKISETQYVLVQEQQKISRVKLGLIAVAEKLISNEQAEELNLLQKSTDRRFGDLAIEKGYLTPEQVDFMLEKQGNPYLQLMQILTENNVFSVDELEELLNDYIVDNGFQAKDLEVLKNGDLDSIIALFIKTDNSLVNDYLALAVRYVIRFINSRPLVNKVQVVKEYSAGNLSYQRLTGDNELLLGFASNDNELLEIASAFAKEDFNQLDEDSFDSVCEFINCINGLFATELSHNDVILEIMPPGFGPNQKLSGPEGVFIVPMSLNGKRVDLIAVVNGQVDQ